MAQPRVDEESPTFAGMVISPCSMYRDDGAERMPSADDSPARFDQWLTATNLLVSRSVASDADTAEAKHIADAPGFCFGSWLQATEAASHSPSLSSRKSPNPANTMTPGASSYQHDQQAGNSTQLLPASVTNNTDHDDTHDSPVRHREASLAPAEEVTSPAQLEFHTPSARPSHSLLSAGRQEGQQPATSGRTNYELAWPCTGDGLPPPTRYFHTDGQRAYDSMAATPASCYDSATPLPGGAGVAACSGRLDYGSDGDCTPGSDFSSRTCQPEIGAMLARMALRPAHADPKPDGAEGQTSKGATYFRQLNAAAPKSPEQRVIELMVGKVVPKLMPKFAGFGVDTSQQQAAEGQEDVRLGRVDVISSALVGEHDDTQDGSSRGEDAARGAGEDRGEEASLQQGYTSSSDDELDDELAQQLTPTSCKSFAKGRDGQSSPMADLILMMMTPAPPTHLSVLDE